VKVEVRATGLKGMREKRGLTQRKLAHDLGISQNYTFFKKPRAYASAAPAL
jgi:predicted transcriptional regulator